jgi:hypothetical protein
MNDRWEFATIFAIICGGLLILGVTACLDLDAAVRAAIMLAGLGLLLGLLMGLGYWLSGIFCNKNKGDEG